MMKMKKILLILGSTTAVLVYVVLLQLIPAPPPSVAMAYPPPPTMNYDLCEPNNLMKDAKPFESCDITVVDASKSYISPYISHYADVDWYTFEITETRTGVTVTLSGNSGEETLLPGDYDLAVFGPVVSTTNDVEGAAMFGNAMFGNAMFGNAMFGNAMFGNAMFGNAMFGNAMFGNAMFGNAMFGNAMFGNAMFGNAMFGNAMFGNAMFGNAMFGNSLSRSNSPERIGFNARNNIGTYHIAVWNGDPKGKYARGRYRLTVQTGEPNILECSPTARSLPNANASPYQELPEVTANTDTIILTNLPRMEQYYGIDMAAWQTQLDALAAHSNVNGVVFDVSLVPTVTLAYDEWDSNVCDVQAANEIAIAIRDALKELVEDQTRTLKYVVVIGSDEIIPFYRAQDLTELWNEWEYGLSPTGINQNSATFAALEEYDSYILTDDFYVDFRPFGGQLIPFERYLPDYAIGRLVETPEEIAGMIDGFLNQGHDTLDLSAASALVYGYDFLLDGAEKISNTLSASGITVNPGHPNYISDTWTKSDMETIVNERYELSSLNGHFTHWLAQPADPTEGNFESAAVDDAASGILDGILIFSVGCHSGLNVPDENSDDAVARRDFAQAFNYKGTTYIGNTGFGYGESEGIDYSEQLMALFAKELLHQRGADPNTIGGALRWAKLKYFTTHKNWKHYDDKVTLEAVLYGLPMVQIQTAQNNLLAQTTTPRYVPAALNAETDLISNTLTITNEFILENRQYGQYHRIDNNLFSEMHQPVLPLRVIDLADHYPSARTDHYLARGVLLQSARSNDVLDFNPVIAPPPITDTAIYTEPLYNVQAWNPAQLAGINRANTANELLETLLIVPAQYKGTHTEGTERLYEQMEFVVYYSTVLTDVVPPTFWIVEGTMRGGHPFFSIDVQDNLEANTSNYNKGIHRVVVTYLTAEGWDSEDLAYNERNYRWEGTLESETEPVGYFVQAVDEVGNVSFYNNKSEFLYSDYERRYLPLIIKNYPQ